MKLEKNTKVSVPCGSEMRVKGTIISGPHLYTPEELSEKIRLNEENGYSTNRMSKSYYVVKTHHGRMTCSTSHVRRT